MYIIIDLFNPLIVNVIQDEEGETIYFDSWSAADEYSKDVQEPLIIRIH